MSGKAIAAKIAGALDEASAAIGKKEFRVTFIRPGPTTGPTYAPVPGTPTRHQLRGVRGKFHRDEIDGTLIQRGDVRFTVEATSIVPATSDKVEIDGKPYSVIDVDQVSPGGEALLYKVQVRK